MKPGDVWLKDGAPGSAASAADPDAPCLQVITPPNTSDESGFWSEELCRKIKLLSGSARRSAYALQRDAEAIVEKWGVNNTVFITLTFGGGGQGPSVAWAQKCFDSFLTHVLSKLFPGGIKVLERGAKRGRVHFHLLCDAGEDVRTGVDFLALERGDRRSFGPRLRFLLSQLVHVGKRYGFGKIAECDPIKSNREGVARYVCKYVSKHFAQRQDRDKGARLRSYWGSARREKVASCLFSWGGKGGERGWLWRAKLNRWGEWNGISQGDTSELKRRFGPRWAYHLAPFINATPLDYYPRGTHAIKDGQSIPDDANPESGPLRILRPPPKLSTALLYGKLVHWVDPDFREEVDPWVLEVRKKNYADSHAMWVPPPNEVTTVWADGRIERGPESGSHLVPGREGWESVLNSLSG